MKSACQIAAIGVMALFGAMPSGAEAKDWIDKVEISRDGIDVVPIEVTASAKGYKAIKTSQHRFLLRLYAKATPGERIVAGKVGSYKVVRMFEAGEPGKWDQVLEGREIGGGEAKSVSRSYSVTIKLSQVTWSKNPVDVCNEMLSDKRKKGYSVAEVLGKNWDAKTYVYFEFQALAARAGKAKSDKWNINNTAGQRHSFAYSVPVTCLAGN